MAKEKTEHKGKRKMHQMLIKRAASGGYIAKHPNSEGSLNHEGVDTDGKTNLNHVLPDMEALHDHMEQNMGEAEPGEEGGAPQE